MRRWWSSTRGGGFSSIRCSILPVREPPIEQTANPVRNPTVELPFPAEEIVAGLDAVLVTHCHKDHFDETAERLLPRDVPVFCQPEDEQRLRAVGLDVRPVEASLDWNGLVIHRRPARHGFGAMAEALAPVSGFVARRALPRRRHRLVRGCRGDDRALPAACRRCARERRIVPRGRVDRDGDRRRARGGRDACPAVVCRRTSRRSTIATSRARSSPRRRAVGW